MPVESPSSAAQVHRRKRKIMRIELSSCIVCAILGGAFFFGDRVLHDISIFLLGWAVGCAVHLATLIVERIAHRGTPREQ
jgi:hypothetical protein